jgi:hypothetical protein
VKAWRKVGGGEFYIEFLQVLEPGTVGVHVQHEKPVISGEIPRGYRYGATLRRDRRYDGRVWLEKSG